MSTAPERAHWRTPTAVLICGGLILTVAMGIRHGFGLFLQPMSADLRWGRETFALAIAVQNLMWGLTQPFAGMVADKYGTARVVVAGALLYALGLVAMAHATTPGDARAARRRADRHRPVGRHVQRDLRRAGALVPAGEAQHGPRDLRRRRLVRPVRDAAAHASGCCRAPAGTSRCSRSPRSDC